MRRIVRRIEPHVAAWQTRPHDFYPDDVLERIDELGAIYIHIPKTGGTSLCRELYGRDLGHRPWMEVRLFHPLRYRRLTTFAVVREPIDRFLSSYDYLKQGGRNAMDAKFGRNFVDPHVGVNEFIAALDDPQFRKQVMDYFHFRPQADYVATNARCMVDRLARLDHLDGDVSLILGKAVSFPALNKTGGKRSSKDILTQRSVEALHTHYEKDFRLWDLANKPQKSLYRKRY